MKGYPSLAKISKTHALQLRRPTRIHRDEMTPRLTRGGVVVSWLLNAKIVGFFEGANQLGRKVRRLAVTMSCLLLTGSALAALPANADDKTGATHGTSAAANAGQLFTVTIPTVDAKDSSIDTDTLKAILGGDIAHHADELAKLSATSIQVPEIDVTYKAPDGGGGGIAYALKDVDFESIKDGVAQTASIGSAEATGGQGIDFKYAKMSTGLFDIGGLLAFYGMVSGSADQPLKPLYQNLDMTGASLVGPDFKCDMGEATMAEFKARPTKTSFTDMITLLSSADFQKGNKPTPAEIGKLLGFYVDFFSAFETSPMELKSLNCSGKAETGGPVTFSMGPLTVGAFANSHYPAIEVKNLNIDAGDSGKVSLGALTMKSIDLTAPLKLLASASGDLTEDWFTANARKLIPAFDGFSFSDLKMDVPDTESPGQRIKATVADFDLSMKDYFEGIPTTIGTTSHHIVFDVPPAVTGQPDSMDQLRQLGIDKFDLGFDLGIHRDATAKSIIIDKLAMDGANLGSVNLSGTMGNVDDALFAGDQDTSLAAAMAMTVKTLKLDVTDSGMGDIVLKQAGSQNGMDLATTRASMGAMAQAVVLAGLGATPEGKALSDAVAKFIGGAKSISVTATAKDPAGLTAADLAAAQTDPTTLSGKVKIAASAQ
jgi:hypothetical protein